MNMSRTLFYITVIMVVSLSAISGCQKKVTKVMEPAAANPKTPEIIAQPKAENPDTGSFVAANLQGDLLREAKEALQNIYFDFDKAILLPKFETQLTVIGKFMLAHSTMRVLIAGNCDERGSAEYNIALGEKRARAAKDFLTALGVPEKNLETTSYGKERLAVSGCTDDPCHAKNRRDEFTVLQSNLQPVSSAQ